MWDRLKNITAQQLGADLDKISPDARLRGDLCADSLKLVELIMAIEKEFDTVIPDEKAEEFVTVGDALDYIKSHI